MGVFAPVKRSRINRAKNPRINLKGRPTGYHKSSLDKEYRSMSRNPGGYALSSVLFNHHLIPNVLFC